MTITPSTTSAPPATCRTGAQQRPVPSPLVKGLQPYSPGRPATGIDLCLDANESLTPPPATVAALAGISADDLCRYPSARNLEERLASTVGIDQQRVLVTAGVDDGLERAIRVVCSPGRNAVLTTPSFAMLRRYVCLTGAWVNEIAWWSGPFPVDQVCRTACQETALVTVVSPNNPTGATISPDDFNRLVTSLPNALILLDHAYVELADENLDLTRQALAYPNVLVFRTFSKAWGLAGLRVGWVAGDHTVISWLRSVGQPYSVSALSLLTVDRLLAAPSQRWALIDRVRRQRSRLRRLLSFLGAEPLPSEANFVLARFADAGTVWQGLAERGIAVRTFANDPQLREWLRITLPGDEVAYQRLETGLREGLAGPGRGKSGSQPQEVIS